MIGLLFGWTKWRDVLVFNFIHQSYLLQGRENKITGAKSFKIVPCKGFWDFARCDCVKKEDLIKSKLFKQQL